MTEIKTRWITSQYDPSASPPALPTAQEGQQHLVYAALLDGVRGRIRLVAYTGISRTSICKCLIQLRDAGYVTLSRREVGLAAYEVAAYEAV